MKMCTVERAVQRRASRRLGSHKGRPAGHFSKASAASPCLTLKTTLPQGRAAIHSARASAPVRADALQPRRPPARGGRRLLLHPHLRRPVARAGGRPARACVHGVHSSNERMFDISHCLEAADPGSSSRKHHVSDTLESESLPCFRIAEDWRDRWAAWHGRPATGALSASARRAWRTNGTSPPARACPARSTSTSAVRSAASPLPPVRPRRRVQGYVGLQSSYVGVAKLAWCGPAITSGIISRVLRA